MSVITNLATQTRLRLADKNALKSGLITFVSIKFFLYSLSILWFVFGAPLDVVFWGWAKLVQKLAR